ncbi:PspC domain-containing protein [Acinetobacter populi]|uniref:PspC family transcriptional regulator n=1 Tax=Acinetobacter populi TaxID=1582270 RepID=A0A1Z9YTV0_9GAMM|nr:PspC domain-containing protein [Acinetobacter populi]OUY05611.1 PspC family transcriptional regulator [Acinetobacter populi]
MANQGLYRSNQRRMIAGVMGGIAERFDWNATLLRIIFVIVSVMSAAFPGILVYLVLWLLIPKQNREQKTLRTVN